MVDKLHSSLGRGPADDDDDDDEVCVSVFQTEEDV